MAEQDLINLVAKTVHDLNDCVTWDVGEALVNDEDIDDWAALPLHMNDLAKFMLRYAALDLYKDYGDD